MKLPSYHFSIFFIRDFVKKYFIKDIRLLLVHTYNKKYSKIKKFQNFPILGKKHFSQVSDYIYFHKLDKILKKRLKLVFFGKKKLPKKTLRKNRIKTKSTGLAIWAGYSDFI